MHPPTEMTQVIDGKLYKVATATLLAGNDYWDGHNFERSGTNCFLYKTKKGAYFTVNLTQWQGGHDHIEAITKEEAKELYEGMRNDRVPYKEAFGEAPVEA